jgi:hypothetical protein
MANSPTQFQSGPGGNPKGRKPGSLNRRDAEIWARLEARGDLDPADFLSSLVTNTKEPTELRAQAANMLLPYKYGKRGVIPVPRFIEPMPLPTFNSIEDAENFLAEITRNTAVGELDIQSALELSTLARNWILSKHAAAELELKRITAGETTGDQIIRIEGGLPALPGTNITMPELGSINGYELPRPIPPTIEHEPDTTSPVPSTASTTQT